MEQGNKLWWQSKTVWGGIFSVGAAVLSGTDIGACGDPTGGALGEAQQNIDSVLAGIGGLLAIGGRLSATKSIGKTPEEPKAP